MMLFERSSSTAAATAALLAVLVLSPRSVGVFSFNSIASITRQQSNRANQQQRQQHRTTHLGHVSAGKLQTHTTREAENKLVCCATSSSPGAAIPGEILGEEIHAVEATTITTTTTTAEQHADQKV